MWYSRFIYNSDLDNKIKALATKAIKSRTR